MIFTFRTDIAHSIKVDITIFITITTKSRVIGVLVKKNKPGSLISYDKFKAPSISNSRVGVANLGKAT